MLTTGIAFVVALINKFFIDNLSGRILSSTPKSMEVSTNRDSWQEMTHSNRYDWTDTICAVYENGTLITSGFVNALPSDIIKSPAILLEHSEFVSQSILNGKKRKEEDKYIGHVMAEYFMLDTGRSIKFYKAPKLVAYYGKTS